MFSRWPRYLYQGPAGEIWSVVHLPMKQGLVYSVMGEIEFVGDAAYL